MSTTTPLRLSMAGIASLANVRRPVVTVWRARAAASELPFPDPVSESGTMLFDSDQVVRWLEQTGRGRNAAADRDVAAHTGVPGAASFDSVSALIALRAASGRPLANVTADDLLDLADAADPDDEAFFSEISALEESGALARYVDELADAAYGDAAAYERMLAAHRRHPESSSVDTMLTENGIRLVARVVGALRSAAGGPGSDGEVMEIVDSTGTATDVIVELARDESAAEKIASIDPSAGDGVDPAHANVLRRARRRLRVHGIQLTSDADEQARGSAAERRLHLLVTGTGSTGAANTGTASRAATSTAAVSILSAVDELAMRLDATQLALVVAPSAVLSDAGLDRESDRLRSGVLRSGQVRAIVRLPAGLRVGMPRQSLSLWVLGSAHPDVNLAERWIMVADLSTTKRTAAVDADLIGDLAASLGSYSSVRAHAFRFARLVLTRHLLARRGSLMPATPSGQVRRPGSAADDSVKIETLLTRLTWPAEALSVTPTPGTEGAHRSREATVGQRLSARQLRYLPGLRLARDLVDTAAAGPGRIAVIGPEELLGGERLGGRSIDRARFVAEHPSGRFTEPGDVVFCTSPRPRAIVDREGLSVVLYPARILRIGSEGDDQVLPDVLAADVNARDASDSSWRSWTSRGVDPRQRAALARTFAALRTDRDATLRRLALLDELESTLVDSVCRGDLALTAPSAPNEPAPLSKGTR